MSDVFEIMNLASDVEEVKEESFKIKPLYGPFDFVNSINSNKNLFKGADNPDLVEACYLPWQTNKALSYFPDTIPYANFINMNYHLDKKLQYDFLINKIRPKNRRSAWSKPEKNSDVDLVKEIYGYSQKKAEVAVSLLSAEQLKELKRRINKGGLKK